MDIQKPFNYSVALRSLIQKQLTFKFKVNEDLRVYSKTPVGETITFDQLLVFIEKNHKNKRDLIPENQLYLKHVVNYWKNNQDGNHEECVRLWNAKPLKDKKFKVQK